MKFELTSTYKPTGDQPQAIEKLTEGINKGYTNQTLLGVTGSGKTFAVANVINFMRGTYRVRGENIEVYPSYENKGLRSTFKGDSLEGLAVIHPVTGKLIENLESYTLYPAKHYVSAEQTRALAIESIKKELKERLKYLEDRNKTLEAHRLRERTNYDLEMINTLGYCKGIENYSRYFDGRKPGEPPFSLLAHFPKDYLTVIDESHMTIPQINGMYRGDRARKEMLVDFGFRLPSAYDNPPLKFEEFKDRVNQVIYTSATPAEYELKISDQVVEQLIR